MQNMLYILLGITILVVGAAVGVALTKPFSSSAKKHVGPAFAVFLYMAAVLQVLMSVSAIVFAGAAVPAESSQEDTQRLISTESSGPTVLPSEPISSAFSPAAGSSSQPDQFGLTWEIAIGDKIVDSYIREESICFEREQDYFALPGIATFRGNHYRDTASYGTAVVENESMEIIWSHPIGSLNNMGGCGWTGQPLVVQWDSETKAIMDTMYDRKKEKDGLIEVIYATLDGYIHFYDLEDGTLTRDPIHMGMNFQGGGSLDPRGYPLLYVGSGLYLNGAVPRMFIVNLITGKIIYEYGNDDTFAFRDWTAFGSSPLVDAESDTLIWPGESGVLYTIKLNTEYDKEEGTISVSPDAPIKTRYTSTYSQEEGRYLGYEASASVVDHYLYASENGGLVHCVDLNTMELIWVQDTGDDSNSSPVFEWDADGNGFIYTAPSLHWTAVDHEGSISIYKLDAQNGEILWEYARECVRYDEIAGGVQCTPLIGKEGTKIGGLILYSISRTPSAYRGVLVALDRETGEKIWEISSGNYAWSSPVALYTVDGRAYIFLANASGVARLIDGATGEVLDTLDFGQTVEASPVAFGNILVIGTREAVYGIKIS